MSKTIFAAAGAGAIYALSAFAAQALPLAPAGGPTLVEQAAQGCGRGFARGPRGVCRPLVRRKACYVVRTPRGPTRVCR
ncbi:GCG_CRPN prefix-to-repeats domain-containing protein [uncultured Enterovirga sp.]|uniref:GCG_CRPN prefix-to-repeats domain-containing protein n=1 Tax=uncultured Enterovirga sp. TaxID=2026352 RepID=UPI0035CAB3FB